MTKPARKSVVALAFELMAKEERRMKRIGKMVRTPEPAAKAAPKEKKGKR